MAGPRVKSGVFLAARLSSTRLPRKALLPLGGKPVLVQAMEALTAVRTDVFALLTDEESRPEFEPLARAAGFEIFAGPRDDVLLRYCLAADRFGVTRIVRATGDNPLVSARQANLCLRRHERAGAELSFLRGAPLGCGVEVVETAALKTANSRSRDPFEHEHITTYLLRRRGEHRVLEWQTPRRWRLPEARVTLDTQSDYQFIQRIFAALYDGKPISTARLVRWLNKNALHP